MSEMLQHGDIFLFYRNINIGVSRTRVALYFLKMFVSIPIYCKKNNTTELNYTINKAVEAASWPLKCAFVWVTAEYFFLKKKEHKNN